jgi:hypothetical protein
MKDSNEKLIKIIIEQAVQLEIARFKNNELISLVDKLKNQLLQLNVSGQVEVPDSSLYR